MGDLTYVDAYEQFVFGIYRFVLIDARGNSMYHANMQNVPSMPNIQDMFIFKDMENNWVVGIANLCRRKSE